MNPIISKKIAGVSVNLESLPTKNDLIAAALNTKEYHLIPKKEATTLINAEIKKSGLLKKFPNKAK